MEGSEQILEYLRGKEINVRSITLDGLNRVKDDVVLPYIKPLLSATTLGDLIIDTTEIKMTLESLNAFNSVDISIVQCPDFKQTKDVQLNISVEEKRRLTLGATVTSELGVNDGSIKGNCTWRNILGRLESLQFSAASGTRVSHGYELQFHKPILSKQNTHIKAEVSKVGAVNPTCGYNTSDYSGLILYQFQSLGGDHSFQVGTLWQHLFGATNTKLPVPIREHFGHHIKCAAKHVYKVDTRDNAAIPTRGQYLEVATEVAGFLGDVNHVKFDGRYQLNFPLILGFSASTNFQAGYLHSMNAGKTTKITDRFFCGGPGSIRGFFADGVGDNSAGRPLGGTAHWGTGVSLIRHLPFHPYIGGLGQFMRIHLFANAGSLVSDKEFFKEPRTSAGAGLILTNGVFRMEINYAIPLLFKQSDIINSGLQFGIGVNFL